MFWRGQTPYSYRRHSSFGIDQRKKQEKLHCLVAAVPLSSQHFLQRMQASNRKRRETEELQPPGVRCSLCHSTIALLDPVQCEGSLTSPVPVLSCSMLETRKDKPCPGARCRLPWVLALRRPPGEQQSDVPAFGCPLEVGTLMNPLFLGIIVDKDKKDTI